MYTPTGKNILLATMGGLLIVDVLSFLAQCEATPAPSYGGVAMSLIFQLCALFAVAFSMQYFSQTYQPARQTEALVRAKAVALAGIFLFLSVMLFRQSNLFSDTLSSRGLISVGVACFR